MRIGIENLENAFETAIQVGEGPYQGNRDAVRSLSILNRAGEGREKLMEVLSGIDDFIQALERVQDAAETINRDAVAIIR